MDHPDDDAPPAAPGLHDPEDALAAAVAGAPATDAPAGAEGGTAAGPGGLDDHVAAWVARVVETYPRPVHPLTREWDVSVQGLVRLVPLLPRFATAPLALLDRLGAVTVGPERVGLDGTDVEWDRVVEVRTEPAWACLSAAALEADLARFVTVLPPVPGRGWLVRRVSELLLSLYLAVLPAEGDGAPVADLEAALAEDGGPLLDHVVTSVTFTRRFGQGEATASVPSALLQLALPGTAEVIVRTARDRGVAVTRLAPEETGVGSVVTRAATWRRTALTLRDDVAARWGGR
ncbi:hypothetical protein GC089_03640 [Cellulomonas sp. JZ18]|uniref:hypothetical protein n=1 Tax=Cellulomonas sp. JZ18 TaxID=2654191 RepID=UPI0012D383DB|nr:hypothetical protein [Cellulomonas sp. JZ18]QGQ18511.1 hypothetical protein GC089_03640 [Cellulomonas sp. JZ18]